MIQAVIISARSLAICICVRILMVCLTELQEKQLGLWFVQSFETFEKKPYEPE